MDVLRRQGCIPRMIVRLQLFFLHLPVANLYKASANVLLKLIVHIASGGCKEMLGREHEMADTGYFDRTRLRLRHVPGNAFPA